MKAAAVQRTSREQTAKEGGRSDLCAQKRKAFQSSSLRPERQAPALARAEQHTRARLHSVNGQSVPSGNTQKRDCSVGRRGRGRARAIMETKG